MKNLNSILKSRDVTLQAKFCIVKSMDFPGGSDGKVSVYSARDPDSIPGLGRSPGEGNGNPLQCSCLENPRDRGAWWAAVCGVTEFDTTEAT